MSGTSWGACHEQFLAACRQPPYAPEGGDAGVRLRDAGRRLWPCPQRPGAGVHLYKYNSGTGNWDDYTRLLNRTGSPIPLRRVAARCRRPHLSAARAAPFEDELEFARFDLRQVEHLIDEAKKVSPGAVHAL